MRYLKIKVCYLGPWDSVVTETSESEQRLGLGSGQGRARDNLVGS